MGIFDWLSGKRKQPKKETLTDYQKHWLGLVDIRVNAISFDFIKKEYTVDSHGEGHYDEYKINEHRVPKEKRQEVAQSRVEGLLSIKDYIKTYGSEEQKFHYESSLKGAVLYASSLENNPDLIKLNDEKIPSKTLVVETSEAEDYFQESFKNRDNEDFHLAIENISKAIAIDATKGVYYFNRAAVKQTMFDYESAILDFTKSIDLKFEHLEAAYFYRAKCKIYIQDIKGAKVDIMKLLELGHLEWVEQFEYWIDSFEELGYDEFIKTFPF